MRIKPFYIVFKWYPNSPKQSYIEIAKEWDETHIWDSPLYEVLGYFDSRKDAKEFITNLKSEITTVFNKGNLALSN